MSLRRIAAFTLILALLAGAGYAYTRLRTHLPKAIGGKRPTFTPAEDTLLHDRPLPAGLMVDSIVAQKAKRLLIVYSRKRPIKAYRVALGDAPVGHKHFEGDEKTPEGLYHIDGKNPHSQAHKSLGISYPNAADKAYAARHGQPPGGLVKIHGIWNGQGHIGKAHLLDDWTNGCIAITDEEIDELYDRVKVGIPVLILP